MAALTADIVGLIRKTILDSYKYSDGFPILKELIQNANDAGASKIEISFSDGIPKASHELLRNPAMIVYNDGGFSPENERGLQRIADNNKEADKSKIGKFGLGMKSIFHLCDMFFYAVNTSEVSYHLETINPWEDDGRHPEWKDFSDVDKALFEKSLPVDMRKTQGFLLWIPEKTKDKASEHITQDFIDLRNPFAKSEDENIVDKLKVTLALLSKVTPAKTSLKEITIEHNGKRTKLELVKNGENFSVQETSERKCENLAFDSYRPEIPSILAEPLLVKAKSLGIFSRENEIDCQFVFLKQPLPKNQSGKLHVQYCVYLPLENPKIEIDLPLSADYYILFHGNFSVDSGRTGIQGFQALLEETNLENVDDTETFYRFWNKFVAQQVLFPSIPAFFDSAAKSPSLNLSSDEINTIISVMQNFNDYGKVPLLKGNKFTVSKKAFALCCVPSSNLFKKEWKSFDVQENYLFVPETDDLESLDNVFPPIKDGSANFVCKDFFVSSILPETYAPNFDLIFELLSSSSFKAKDEIELLRNFINLNKSKIQTDENLQSALINSLKRNFLNLEMDLIFSLRKPLSELIANVNEATGNGSLYKIYFVGSKERTATGFEDENWKTWWNLDSKFILAPGFLRSEHKEECTEDALIRDSGKDEKDSVCDFVNQNVKPEQQYLVISGIYANLKQVIKKIREKFPKLHLFEIRNMQSGKTEYADFELIQNLKDDKELFFAIRPNDYEHVLYLYSQLLKTETRIAVYTISDSVVTQTGIEKDGILPADEAGSIIGSFSSHDDFKSFEYNKDFLSDFLEKLCQSKPVIPEKAKHHIRFLISGLDKNLLPDEELYIFDTQCNVIWRKIFDECKDNVKIISSNFGAYTRETIIKNENLLKIQILNEKACVNALRHANKTDFLKDEYYASSDVLLTILKELNPGTDKELFYSLPIHINSVSGERQICREGDYLNANGIEFPESFKNPRTLFRLYENNDLAEMQKKFFSDGRTLSYINAIKIVLVNKKEDDDYSAWIFEQIKKSGSRDWQNYVATDEFGLANWIPVLHKQDEFCNLRSILKEGIFSAETDDAIFENLPVYSLSNLDISSDERELLVNRNLLINSQNEELKSLVDILNNMNIDTIPVDSLENLKEISEILKSDKNFPQFAVVWALFQDEKIKDKNQIRFEFYLKIRGEKSDSYELFIKMINSSLIGRKNTVPLFNKIVALLLQNQNKKFSLADINKFPTENGEWKSADEIAASQSELISPEFKLNKETYEILKSKIEEAKESIDGNGEETEKIINSDSSVDEILKTFEPWLSELKQVKLLYVLLYLLKDNFKKAALNCRNKADFECFTKDFNYIQLIASAHEKWSAGYTQEEAIEDKFLNPNHLTGGRHFHTTIHIPLGGEITIHSLSGKLLHVILEDKKNSESLLLEIPYYYDYNGKFEISLAKIQNHDSDIDSKLKNLIKVVLNRAYFQSDDREIDRVLNTISKDSEYSVKAVSIQILDEVFALFKQLKLQSNEDIKSFSKQERELSREKATGKISDEDYIKQKKELISQIQEKFENDEKFKNAIREAVIEKISENQYDEKSVMFELFQNADDAVKDILKTNPKRTFEVALLNGKHLIQVSHYGREINQSPAGADASKYQDDLYNMLTINGSAKSKADGDTGKFGLGFKSVHLICENPVVRSGVLQFEIDGGIYPKNITEIKLNPGETRFELKLENGKNADEILSDFKKNAFFQTIFSKAITKITIDKNDFESQKTEIGNFKSGKVFSVNAENKKYLLFQNLGAKVPFQILFRISGDSEIVKMFDSDGRRIWNTTPLSDGENLPFAINADFVPDTGRKRLADNKKNPLLLTQIANEFAKLLSDFLGTDAGQKSKNSLLSILVASSNIREQIFTDFAKDVLQDLLDNSNLVASGFGTVVTCKRKIVYIAPDSFTGDADRSEEFMKSVQDFLDLTSDGNFYLISRTAKNCYDENQLKDPEQISSLAELFENYVPQNRLTNEILEKFLAVVQNAPKAKLKFNWNNVYLLTESDDWTAANSVVANGLNASDDKVLSQNYSAEVKKFLDENLPKAPLVDLIKHNSGLLSGNSADTNPAEEISLPPPSVSEVYEWWHEENESGKWKDDVENYYEQKKFPSIFGFGLPAGAFKYSSDELFALKEGTIPKEWCLLLWVAAAQSMPYNWGNRDASNKNGIETLKQMGVFDDFCSGVNLEEVYNKYLENTKNDETRIRLFEMLLRIHKYRRNFADYYDLWKNLPAKNSDSKIEDFLVSSEDAELSGCGINLAPGNRTFSVGYRLIIQNLSLCGFWENATEEQMKKLFMEFRALKDYEFNLDGKADAKEFYSALDLPFQVYEEEKKNGEIND